MIIFSKIQEKIIHFGEWIHFRIFGQVMSDEMRNFFKHLSWSFFLGIIAAGILFGLNILAGHWLGPEEYGKYSLVIGLVGIIVMPMTLGLDTASVYYISKAKTEEAKGQVIFSAVSVKFVLIISIFLLLFFFQDILSSFFQVPKQLFLSTLLLSIPLSFRNVTEAFLRGLKMFKQQSIFRVSETILVVCCFLTLVGLYGSSYKSYIFPIILGHAFFVGLSALILWRYVSIRDKRGVSKQLIKYGSIAVMGSFFGILTTSVDKIFIGTYIGSEQLGVYTAYSTPSILFMGQLSALLVNVLFPYLSSSTYRSDLLTKINKISVLLFFPLWIGLCLFIFLSIILFGKEYPVDYWLILEFGFLGAIYLYFVVLWWFINARGSRGIRFTSVTGICLGLLFVGLMYIFKEELTLRSVVLFLIISILLGIFLGNVNNKQKITEQIPT